MTLSFRNKRSTTPNPFIYELVTLAKKSRWQIYDTYLDKMIDLDNPANNGYTDFQEYLHTITKGQ